MTYRRTRKYSTERLRAMRDGKTRARLDRTPEERSPELPVPSIREYAADVANMAMMLRQRFYKRHLPPIPTDSHQILTRNRQESQITGRRNGVADGARTQTARTPTIPLTTPFIGAQRFSVPWRPRIVTREVK